MKTHKSTCNFCFLKRLICKSFIFRTWIIYCLIKLSVSSFDKVAMLNTNMEQWILAQASGREIRTLFVEERSSSSKSRRKERRERERDRERESLVREVWGQRPEPEIFYLSRSPSGACFLVGPQKTSWMMKQMTTVTFQKLKCSLKCCSRSLLGIPFDFPHTHLQLSQLQVW